ncbi:MAG: iron ABC transporter permease [Gammaproteobacteria bacterium]|nr:iron ABC transporter permease [Gammaproteobacteria bacterium]
MNGVPPLGLFLTLAALSVAALALALASGSVELGWGELWAVLSGAGADRARDIVLELRLNRAEAAFATGGLLGLAGALMQALLRNPLADPYVLGISGGAAVGALLALVAGLAAPGPELAALAGATLSMTLVFGLAHGRGGWTPTRLLLTGVVIAAGWGALISFILTVSPERGLRSMLFWLMGDLARTRWGGAGLVLLAAALALALPLGRALNLLARGELQAAALGVEVPRVRLAAYGLASLTTAAAVTLAGSVGFVGLVIPHMLRLVGATDHRVLLPATVLLGGSLLVLADTLARTALAPQQLPVGVVTALVGVPLFLYLLNRRAAA